MLGKAGSAPTTAAAQQLLHGDLALHATDTPQLQPYQLLHLCLRLQASALGGLPLRLDLGVTASAAAAFELEARGVLLVRTGVSTSLSPLESAATAAKRGP